MVVTQENYKEVQQVINDFLATDTQEIVEAPVRKGNCAKALKTKALKGTCIIHPLYAQALKDKKEGTFNESFDGFKLKHPIAIGVGGGVLFPINLQAEIWYNKNRLTLYTDLNYDSTEFSTRIKHIFKHSTLTPEQVDDAYKERMYSTLQWFMNRDELHACFDGETRYLREQARGLAADIDHLVYDIVGNLKNIDKQKKSK